MAFHLFVSLIQPQLPTRFSYNCFTVSVWKIFEWKLFSTPWMSLKMFVSQKQASAQWNSICFEILPTWTSGNMFLSYVSKASRWSSVKPSMTLSLHLEDALTHSSEAAIVHTKLGPSSEWRPRPTESWTATQRSNGSGMFLQRTWSQNSPWIPITFNIQWDWKNCCTNESDPWRLLITAGIGPAHTEAGLFVSRGVSTFSHFNSLSVYTKLEFISFCIE